MKKNRIIAIVMCLVIMATLLCSLTGCSSTTEDIVIPTVEKNVYVYDQDEIISDDVEEKLNKMLTELEEETGAEFAIISVESLHGNTIEAYSNKLFNTLGIGKQGEDNGVLLLFSRADKRVRLEIGRGLEGCLNDSKCGRILDNYFVPHRENDDYTKATEMTVMAVMNAVAEEYKVDIEGLEKATIDEEEPEKELPWWVWLIIIAFIILYVWADLEGGGSSGRHYYGGSSRSSSRGSFGGGRSGGGGASR